MELQGKFAAARGDGSKPSSISDRRQMAGGRVRSKEPSCRQRSPNWQGELGHMINARRSLLGTMSTFSGQKRHPNGFRARSALKAQDRPPWPVRESWPAFGRAASSRAVQSRQLPFAPPGFLHRSTAAAFWCRRRPLTAAGGNRRSSPSASGIWLAKCGTASPRKGPPPIAAHRPEYRGTAIHLRADFARRWIEQLKALSAAPEITLATQADTADSATAQRRAQPNSTPCPTQFQADFGRC